MSDHWARVEALYHTAGSTNPHDGKRFSMRRVPEALPGALTRDRDRLTWFGVRADC